MIRCRLFGAMVLGALVASASAAARDLQPISILEPDPALARPIEVLGALPSTPVATDRMPEILDDGSLQPGDVVMFRDGPRVFVQSHGFPPWSEDDFADVATARALTDRQRRAILALTMPPAPLRVTIGQAQ